MVLIISITTTASAQIFGSEDQTQNEASVLRLYLWDKPTTDSLTYKGILPDMMRIATMFSSDGKAKFVLTGSDEFTEMGKFFTTDSALLYGDRIIGKEYLASKVIKFSWFSKKQLKQYKGTQKITVAAFNEMEKYTMMSKASRTVYGKRLADGTIVPDFGKSDKVVTSPLPPKEEEVKIEKKISIAPIEESLPKAKDKEKQITLPTEPKPGEKGFKLPRRGTKPI